MGGSRSRAPLFGRRAPGVDELLPRPRDLCFNPDRRRLFLCDFLRGRRKYRHRHRLRSRRSLKRAQRDFPVQSDGGSQSAGETENSFRQSQTILRDLKKGVRNLLSLHRAGGRIFSGIWPTLHSRFLRRLTLKPDAGEQNRLAEMRLHPL